MIVDEPAPAKVNLFLQVTGRRDDGYHLLDSLAVFAGAADRLSAEPANELTLQIAGPFAAGLTADADNLVLRAARALAAATGHAAGARLRLEKHLPLASGIGGGSADAAATLRLLMRLWGVQPAPGELHAIALALGADVPVCLASRPARMAGIGECLRPAPTLPAFGLVLANPGTAVATAEVFRARTAGFSTAAVLPDAWPDVVCMAADLQDLRNDLEPSARALCPAIGEVVAALRATNCRLARMSGSGATCFALYDTPGQAELAAASLARSGWWRWGGAAFAPVMRHAVEPAAGGA